MKFEYGYNLITDVIYPDDIPELKKLIKRNEGEPQYYVLLKPEIVIDLIEAEEELQKIEAEEELQKKYVER